MLLTLLGVGVVVTSAMLLLLAEAPRGERNRGSPGVDTNENREKTNAGLRPRSPELADADTPDPGAEGHAGWFAPATVRGRVVLDGTGIAGARVISIPARSYVRYLTGAESECPETVSGPDGSFVITDPRDTTVYVAAMSKEGFGFSSLPIGGADAEVEIEIEPVRYERLSFVDEAGKQVSVLGHDGLVGLLPNPIVEYQGPNVPDSGTALLFAKLSGIDLAVGENEAVSIAVGNISSVHFGPTRVFPAERELSFPGFATATIHPRGRPMSEWPASTRVVVRHGSSASPGTRRCRVVFPNLVYPADWLRDGMFPELQIDFGREVGEGQYLIYPLSRRQIDRTLLHWEDESEFVWMHHDVLPVSRFALACRLEERDGVTLIVPPYPEFAFVDLRFPETHPEMADASGYVMLVDGRSDLTGSFVPAFTGGRYARGWLVAPGHFRVGPLLCGRYRLKLVWNRGSGGSGSPPDREFELDLEGGSNSFVVKDIDVVVAESPEQSSGGNR